MKMYKLKDLMVKINELMEIIGVEKISSTDIRCEKEECVLCISYVHNGDIIRVQYMYEVDEDEDDGYFKICRTIKNGEITKRNSLEELIIEVRKMNSK